MTANIQQCCHGIEDLKKTVAGISEAVAVIRDRGARLEETLDEVRKEQKTVRTALDQADGAKGARNLIGHLITGVLAAGGAITAMWSGAFHTPH